ncbi:HET-domain-containing protein [Canariomyces notabilis]|uniref:HET-domain-containing protein n=1 Tax=Canariomyces notabilis TaxID=2074819 RepID=A0AAN6T7T3_9PEZI|nr:HET-domain-containing protein [Canariomyces arenarius]
MFASRILLPRGVRRGSYSSQSRLRPNPRIHCHSQFQYETPRRQPLTFKERLDAYLFLSFTAQFIIFFAYEPLRDYGLFDTMAQSTVFRLLPLKKVKPCPNSPSDTPYQPITRAKEIRLLVLEPGEPGDEVRCRLVNVQLSWRTKYEALSYVWGSSTVTRPLRCSGHAIPVTVSLYDALNDLRYRDRERLLWVDAVCINQVDNDEKATQIMLMGEIYSRARQVLIYLGKTDPSVEDALKHIRFLDWKFMPLHIQGYCSRLASLGALGNALIDMLPNMKPIPENDRFNWDPVIALLQRPWFQRTWIIQEAILAKRAQVICGDEAVSWAMFERVVVAMNMYLGKVGPIRDYHLIDFAVRGVHMMRAARRDRYRHILMPEMWLMSWLVTGSRVRRQEYTKLLDLVTDSRGFQCTNPRDKIFGMLGVTAEDTSRSGYVTPDYKISTGDVFRNFVLWEIFNNRSLRVLGCSSDKAGGELGDAFPSWVPDFTRLDPHHGLTRWENRASFHASGKSSAQARVSEDGTVLYLRGRAIDRIHTVGEKTVAVPDVDDRRKVQKANWYEPFETNKGMIEEARDIWLTAMDRWTRGGRHILAGGNLDTKKGEYETGIPVDWVPARWESFVRTMVCNRTDFGQEATGPFLCLVAAYVRLVLDGPKLDPSFVRRWRGPVGDVAEAVIRTAQSRRFASTEMGLVGYVPMRAKKGDLIVVFYGASVPYIIRMATSGRWYLVGECYMHGLMSGEGMRIEEEAEREFAIA